MCLNNKPICFPPSKFPSAVLEKYLEQQLFIWNPACIADTLTYVQQIKIKIAGAYLLIQPYAGSGGFDRCIFPERLKLVHQT